MTPQANSYVLAKTFFRGASQLAFKAASQLARCNQILSVVMNVIFDAQQRFSGCAAGMIRECFDSGEDEAHCVYFYSDPYDKRGYLVALSMQS